MSCFSQIKRFYFIILFYNRCSDIALPNNEAALPTPDGPGVEDSTFVELSPVPSGPGIREPDILTSPPLFNLYFSIADAR